MTVISYKCDRCGKEFRSYGMGYQHYPVLEDTRSARVTTYGHFCGDCAREFTELFMQQKRIE